MTVEIVVLSGARRGERLVLDRQEFRVGSDRSGNVFLESDHDVALSYRSVHFRFQQDDGWHLRSSGGEVLLNVQPIVGWTRIRSGDMVRMSESGPDFCFRILSGAAAAQAMSNHGGAGSFRLSAGGSPPPMMPVPESSPGLVTAPKAESSPWSDVPESDVGIAQPQPNGAFHAAMFEHLPTPAPSLPTDTDQRWGLWVAGGFVLGGLVLSILALVVLRSPSAPPNIVVNVSQPGLPPVPGGAAPVAGPITAATNPSRETAVAEPQPPETPPAKKAQQPSVVDVAAQLGEATFLLQAVKADRSWPFATCVAISGDTLLTTAREAEQLAAMRDEKGFTIWVTQPASGFKEQVQEIRINGVYASLADKPTDWIYYDLGLLSVRGKLPKAARLASAEQLAGVDEGAPVACFGFTHDGEKITRFDKFEPNLARGKVYLVTAAAELPGRPRLLHVTADIPKNAYGSPVVDAEGRSDRSLRRIGRTGPGRADHLSRRRAQKHTLCHRRQSPDDRPMVAGPQRHHVAAGKGAGGEPEDSGQSLSHRAVVQASRHWLGRQLYCRPAQGDRDGSTTAIPTPSAQLPPQRLLHNCDPNAFSVETL